MDISPITDDLFIGAQPKTIPVDALQDRNIRLFISMIGGRRPPQELEQSPCQLLWLKTFDTALTPIPTKKLTHGVQTALSTIQNGGKVLVCCAQGRHRSVVMGAAILIALGYQAPDAMSIIRARRAVADPHAGYVRWQILRFENYWAHRAHSFPGRVFETYAKFMATALSRTILFLRPERWPLTETQ